MNLRIANVAVATLLAWVAMPDSVSLASFHFMQIEKIVGGVHGDPGAQAIQLRMRVAIQNQVYRGKLIAFDAAGQNPIVIVDFETTVPNDAAGSRVLVTTPAMAGFTNPPAVPDFIMEAPIPESYLAAGSLVFENDEETLSVWRLSWGGDAYTGETLASLTNDDDREFGPPFAGPLPSTGLQVLEFTGTTSAKSTSNAADYRLSDGPGVLTNNAADSFTLIAPDCDDLDAAGFDSDGDSIRDVCDECPDDAGKSEPGICGCGVADTDSDLDGIPNCNDSNQDDGNENENENGNDNVANENENENSNGNVNSNDNGNDNGDPANDNSNENADDGNENDNDGSGGGSAPRGCSSGFGAIFSVMLGLSGLRCFGRTTPRSTSRSKNATLMNKPFLHLGDRP